jgi:hypothetical protein
MNVPEFYLTASCQAGLVDTSCCIVEGDFFLQMKASLIDWKAT